MSKKAGLILLLLVAVWGNPLYSNQPAFFLLAKDNKALYKIYISGNTGTGMQYAGNELKKHLEEISNTSFAYTKNTKERAIVLGVEKKTVKTLTDSESFRIHTYNGQIHLTGSSERTLLYAVYEFLSLLGCRWAAPQFSFYNNFSQHIPRKTTLEYVHNNNIQQAPAFKYRKLYVEEGLTHDLQNLKQIADWMPKVKLNVLVFPTDYQGHGKVKWANWRNELIPELKKRGILIEVGGHGYQNFLNASMNSGNLFNEHPEWFGMNADGKRTPAKNMVFCTSNATAENFLFANISKYLKAHPEIDIFDFWPPDMELWCKCSNCMALGSETGRHAILVNNTADFLAKEFPQVKMECLAYSKYTHPPENNIKLNKAVLVDFCPILQNFDSQIYEAASENNSRYMQALKGWFNNFEGDISIYSYYRKYKWRSLPNIIPHYMQNDLKYFKGMGVKGISVYCEPGDWFTYGVNHYSLAALAWDPYVNIDSTINAYCKVVYRQAHQQAAAAYNVLENTVRFASQIAEALPKPAEKYNLYITQLNSGSDAIIQARKKFDVESVEHKNLHRLYLMFQYAVTSARLQPALIANNTADSVQVRQQMKTVLNEGFTSGLFIPRRGQ